MNKIFIIALVAGMIALPSMAGAQEIIIEAPEEDLQMTLEQRREEWKEMSEHEKEARRQKLREERLQRREARKAIEENDVFVDVSEEEEAGIFIAEDIIEEPKVEEVIVIEQISPPKAAKSRGNWNKVSPPKYND